jgi:hypothetical protein
MRILLAAANARKGDLDANLARHLAAVRRELRWWSADELRAQAPIVSPRDLADLLDRIARGDLPGPDHDLGV